MISTQTAIKIPADVFRALDDYHAAVAIALQKKGRVVIEDNAPGAAPS
jgi:hypothetical protein